MLFSASIFEIMLEVNGKFIKAPSTWLSMKTFETIEDILSFIDEYGFQEMLAIKLENRIYIYDKEQREISELTLK